MVPTILIVFALLMGFGMILRSISRSGGHGDSDQASRHVAGRNLLSLPVIGTCWNNWCNGYWTVLK